MRPRSAWELNDYLRRKNTEEPVAKKIIAKLTKLDLVNDVSFARSWVENRRLLKPVSKRRLQKELKQKRVDETIIEEALREDETDERDVLRDLIARKRKQSKYQDELKLMQYLARQGFSYTDIKSALSDAED
jgi:regulatory protein